MGSIGDPPTVTSSSTASSTVEPSHPLYLYHSDSPRTILVTKSFNGTGYGGWRKSILIGLSCKNKLGIINGTFAKPNENSPLYKTWCRCNDMVTTWILNNLETEIRESVMYTKSAQKLWKEIEQRYGKPHGTKVFQIRKELASISQGASNIASYFNRIKKLWDELAYSISYPECTCGCKEAFQKLEEEQKVHQFLMGLNESYSGARRNILLMKLLSNIDSVYAMLIEAESQVEVQPSNSTFNSDSASFFSSIQKSYPMRVHFESSKVNFESSKKGNTNMVGRYCKKPGHSIDKCYKLHEYPPNPGPKFKRTVACAQVTNPTLAVAPDSHSREGSKAVPIEIGGNILSKEQYKQLVYLLQLSKLTSTPQDLASAFANFAGLLATTDFSKCAFPKLEDSLWIIDSGATNHMTPHKSLVTNIKPFPLPYLITLSNGYKVKSPFLKKSLVLGKLQKCNGLYIMQTKEFGNFVFFASSSVNTIPASMNDMNKSNFHFYPFVLTTSHSILPAFGACAVSNLYVDHVWHLRLGLVPFAKLKHIPYLSDDFTRATWCYLLSSKANAFSILKSFILDVVFHEHIFPYSDSSSSHLFPPPVPSSSIPTSPSPPPPSSPSSSSAPPTYDFSPSSSSFQSF
uniref:Uncharacterized protein LOC104244342 n=1 Tax=Nicotiana sylvestris TaxID=4096 RepID=A0A1U7Y7Z8_NICSY|nr:PREDICTED: uncharacterized protein LOC104244342 [Nicotiana sylvestris]